MTNEPASSRRVSVVDRSPTGRPELQADLDPEPDPPLVHLLETLSDVADSVRAGEYTESRRDGVLMDTVVGRTRCLLLVHEPSRLVRLSPREQEIAIMVSRGRTNQAIAGSLDISVWTVSTHLRRIFAKLAVSSRAEMVAHLLEQKEYSHLAGREVGRP